MVCYINLIEAIGVAIYITATWEWKSAVDLYYSFSAFDWLLVAYMGGEQVWGEIIRFLALRHEEASTIA